MKESKEKKSQIQWHKSFNPSIQRQRQADFWVDLVYRIPGQPEVQLPSEGMRVPLVASGVLSSATYLASLMADCGLGKMETKRQNKIQNSPVVPL